MQNFVKSSSSAGEAARGIKSKNASAQDGRRNNKPPESGKIKPNEVRNPHGRAGKPKPVLVSEYDQLQIAEALRVVSKDEKGDVNALQRLIQVRWFEALKNADEKAIAWCLAEAKELMARRAAYDDRQREAYEWICERKMEFTEAFAVAKSMKRPPPDVMHPDHVLIHGGEVTFAGPMDREARKRWEYIKPAIQVAAVLHDHARKLAKLDPSPKNLADLKGIEKHRRWLMRAVPSRWNWKEQIYCRYSEQEFTNDTVKWLKDQFDAEYKALNRVLARRKRKALAAECPNPS